MPMGTYQSTIDVAPQRGSEVFQPLLKTDKITLTLTAGSGASNISSKAATPQLPGVASTR